MNDAPPLCPECGGTGRKEVGPSHWVQCPACEGRSPDPEMPVETGRQRWPFRLLALYLIGAFLWRAFVPAHEYPMRPAQLLSMAFDLTALAGLIGCWISASRGGSATRRNGAMSALVFWIALAAGLGLWVIRMNGDASWWTGHLKYELSPRTERR